MEVNMKRIIAIILTSLMLFSTVAIAQTLTTTPPLTVNNPVDHLASLISATPTTTPIHSRLIIIRNNRDKITGLRATTTLRVTALGLLIANMRDDDNETLEKARGIVESFEGRMQSGIQHDRQIQRQIKELRSHMSTITQSVASQVPNNSNGDRRDTRIRNRNQDDDGERNNGKGAQNLRQNRRSERNETQTIRRIERIIKSQERIIDRLERRIDIIEDLIDELTP